MKIYGVGALATKGLLAIEITGAALFWRALRERDDTPALQALCHGAAVWLAFIFLTEFFVAYPSESVFRELLLLTIATAIYIALAPERLKPRPTHGASPTRAADPAESLPGTPAATRPTAPECASAQDTIVGGTVPGDSDQRLARVQQTTE
ncbi:MAG: hypothetical protein ACLP50_37080 [Solirubrobacteraceae bacterium]